MQCCVIRKKKEKKRKMFNSMINDQPLSRSAFIPCKFHLLFNDQLPRYREVANVQPYM